MYMLFDMSFVDLTAVLSFYLLFILIFYMIDRKVDQNLISGKLHIDTLSDYSVKYSNTTAKWSFLLFSVPIEPPVL